MGVGTLGLPRGLPSNSILDLTPSFEVGEAGTSERPPISVVDDESFVRKINKCLTEAEPHVMLQREQATEAYRFRDDHQLSTEDAQILKASKRPDTAINEIQKFIKFASGIERRTPTALIYAARSVEDEQAATKGELITKFYEWFCDKGSATFERSLAFEDKLVAGMGFVDIGLSKAIDPQGSPRYARAPLKQMWWPECSRENLGLDTVSPVKWLARESNMDMEDAIEKWPDMSMFIRAAGTSAANQDAFPTFGYGAKKQIPYVVPWIMTAPLNKGSGSPNETKPGKVSILEWQYFDDEPGFYFFDPLQRDDAWLNESDFRKYNRRLSALYKQRITDFTEEKHRVYKRTYLLNRRILLEDPAKLPCNGYTWNAMTGTWDEQDKTFYGIVRVLMSPQRYANAFFRQILEVMGASTKGGYLAESGAITPAQKRDIEETGARPGSVNIVQAGAIAGNKIIPKPIPTLPQGSMEVLQFCLSIMEQITGLSTSLLGTDQANTPGVTLRRRMTSGLVLLAAEFDALSRFRKREGEIVFDFMKLIADDRVIRIGGAFDGQAIRMTKDPFALTYDIVLDENDQDPSLRQMYTDNIMQLAPILVRTGNFFPELLDYVNLPVQIRQKFKQSMQQSEQQKMEMAKQGLVSFGGRGKPRSVEEIQAQTALTKGKALHEHVKAAALAKSIPRDDLRLALDGAIAKNSARNDGEKLSLEALDKMFKALKPSGS